MISTILVPIDGSSAAGRAVEAAAELAGLVAARVILTQVVDPADFLVPEERVAAHLDERAAALRARGILATTAVLRGPVVAMLIEEARRQAADLIVMVRDDRRGPDGWLHRSVTAGVLAATPAPLLLLHATSASALAFGPTLRLVVALDGSPLAAAALPVARTLADALGATVRLVRAISDEALLAAPVIAADGRPINSLDDGAALLHAHGRAHVAAVAVGLDLGPGRIEGDVRFGGPAEVLLAVAAEYAPSLLVMATHGYSGLRRLALGSVAAEILGRGHLPVLLVRPPEHRGPLTPQRIDEELGARDRA